MENRWLMVTSLALLAACGTPPQSESDAGMFDAGRNPDGFVPMADTGPPGCASDTECDDGIDCTSDTCTTSTSVCRHQVVPALCPAGSSCHPTRGCEMGRACGTDTDCEDDDACTVNERCDPAARTCVVDPLDGDGDGDLPRVCGGGDCDDSRGTVHSGATETCNDVDDDCDGAVDETFDFATDPEHCGSCEHGCGLGACVDGACACDSGAAECGDSGCLDTASNPDHCGGCGMACGTYLACADGMCTRCEAPGDPCCRPLRSGRDGRCLQYGGGVPFDSPWLVCIDGACDCPPGETACPPGAEIPTYCADLATDATNCGSCGNECPTGTVCASGTCRCPTGQTLCGTACVDTSSDVMHCDACERRCPFGATCSSGTCRCPTGQTECPSPFGGSGTTCADTSSDVYNCGACGVECAREEYCASGTCIL